jgi:hypothetical protein
VRAPDKGWWCLMVELQWLFQTSCWDPGTGHRGVVHRPRGGGAPRRVSPLSRKKWQCHTAMVTRQSGYPSLLQIEIHHFKAVELFISFLKSPRSSKSEFRARSYTRNTKGCCCYFWAPPLAPPGGTVLCPVLTRKGGATLYSGSKLATS